MNVDERLTLLVAIAQSGKRLNTGWIAKVRFPVGTWTFLFSSSCPELLESSYLKFTGRFSFRLDRPEREAKKSPQPSTEVWN
jgi:hypothetical protein